MAEYTNDLRIKEIGIGEEAGAWGTTLNTQLSLLAEGFSYGVENLGSDANATITMANGASDEARSLYLKITSTSLSATRTVTLAPESVSKVWIIENATTGSQSITITQGGGQHGVTIPNGQVKMIYTTGDSESPSGAYDALDNLELGGNATAVTSVTAPLIEASTSIQTPLIEFTDGDDAITIADGGGLTFSGTATGTVLKGTTSLQTPLIEFTDGDDAITIADGGGITAANGITSTAAANTFGATSFNDADITNVGSISLDTIVSDASPATVTIGYGTNDALNVNSKTVFGSTSQNGFVSIDPADGVADEAYALFVRNNEATDGRNYGLMVRAGSTSADESFSVRDHANAGTYFKVRGDGNVGIGTASPDNLLHIKTTGSTPSIELEQDAGTSYKGLIKLAGNDLEIRGSSGIMEFYTGNNDGDSSTLRMSISAAGTATFEHPIVTQSGATQGYYIENNAGNATTPRITNDANDHTVIRPGKSGGAVQWNNFANSAELMRLSDAGVLTIGSGGISESRVNQNFAITHAAERGGMAINSFYANASGPLFDFNVSRNNTAGSHTVVQNADALGTFIWRGDDGDEFVDAAAIECNVDGTPGNGDMPGRFVFYTSPDGTTGLQERLRITSKGALKARAGDSLATYASTTDHTHEIWQKEAGYGIIKLATAAGTTNQYGVMIDMADDITNTSNWFQRCLAGTDARFYIYSNGDVFTKTGTDIQQSSDRRLKDNITDYSGGLTVLKSLTPRTYTWKEGQGAAGTQYGFVAQEIEESSAVVDNMNLFSIVVPTRDDDKNPLQPDNKQYNTQLSSKDAIYISAIQELSAEIETLKAEVKTLKGE